MKIALPMLLSVALAAPMMADDCRHTAPRHLTAPSDGVRIVEIRASAGSLLVQGTSGSGVRAEGTACSSSPKELEGIQLESRRSGDRLILEVVMGDTRTWSFGRSLQRRLDLTVSLPTDLAVQIDDGSGSIDVRNVAALQIEDGSGAIDVEAVRGAVRIEDGSGGIMIRDAGAIHIIDGSGDIEIRSIRGDVVIEEDGSGGIDIADVAGNVVIEDDGSGSIAVRNVGGDFVVRNDGSGGVSMHGVRGRVSVPQE